MHSLKPTIPPIPGVNKLSNPSQTQPLKVDDSGAQVGDIVSGPGERHPSSEEDHLSGEMD